MAFPPQNMALPSLLAAHISNLQAHSQLLNIALASQDGKDLEHLTSIREMQNQTSQALRQAQQLEIQLGVRNSTLGEDNPIATPSPATAPPKGSQQTTPKAKRRTRTGTSSPPASTDNTAAATPDSGSTPTPPPSSLRKRARNNADVDSDRVGTPEKRRRGESSAEPIYAAATIEYEDITFEVEERIKRREEARTKAEANGGNLVVGKRKRESDGSSLRIEEGIEDSANGASKRAKQLEREKEMVRKRAANGDETGRPRRAKMR